MPRKGSYEPLLNGRLADLLTAEGLNAEAETTPEGTAKRFDVTVRVGGLLVAVEAKIDNRKNARAQAASRLEEAASRQVTADESVAVSYDESLTVQDFDASTVIAWERQPSTGDRDFTTGTVRDFAAALNRLHEDHGDDLGPVAKDLKSALGLAVARLSDNQRRRVCDLLELPTEQELKDGSIKDVTVPAAKRGLLVVACAAMFHARLTHLADEPRPVADSRSGEPYDGPWPPAPVGGCLDDHDVVGSLLEAWDTILVIDYKPIFESACRVLAEPDQDLQWSEAIKHVAKAGVSAARSAAGARHDLLGRIFHWLLEDARYDGSFYTSTPAAALLSGLALRRGDLPDDISEWKVIDPACGTGTLLMAAVQQIRDLRPAAGADADAVKLLEDSITGLDVNATACHMAATTLGLLSPSTQFRHMNIYRMPYGAMNPNGPPDKLDPRLGALELLDKKAAPEDPDTGQGHLQTHWSSGEHVDTSELVNVEPYSRDLVIMNPPYTRDSLRYDHLRPKIEKAMKAREKHLMSGRAGHGSALGSMFIDLGEHLAKLEAGATFAAVLPQSAAGGPAGHKTRKLLADWFHIEWVITSHDQKRIYFSENTNISEILIVARRHDDAPDKRPPTKFVRLHNNPATADAAASLAAALASGAEAPGAAVTWWPAALMAEGQWEPVGITSPHLVSLAGRVASGSLFPVDKLEAVAHVGPAGRRIRDVFTKQDGADARGRRALWHNKPARTRTLRASTDTYIHVKPDQPGRNSRLAESYWSQRSPMLLCARPRLDTGRVVAVMLDAPALSSGWVPARPKPDALGTVDSDQWMKAMAVWWNSTLGVVSIVANSTSKVLSRPEVSLDTMKSLPIPALTVAQGAALAKAFDGQAAEPLTKLSDPRCPVRAALDRAVADTLGLDAADIDQARTELAREPSVQPSASRRAAEMGGGE